jgi:predicted  nucleic acid-binding Zn-ribbon protein
MHIFYLGSLLSETLKLSSTSVKGWLESETSSIFTPVHVKAQKLLDEMRKLLGSLVESSRMLLDNSGREIEKRNMKTYRRARALNKLSRLFLERMQQIEVPEKVSYESFRSFVQEVQKAFLVTEVDVRNWFPRISPFFILDRRKFLTVFEKAKEQLEESNDFLVREYVKTKTLEETFQLIDNLQALEGQLTKLDEQRKNLESERASVEREMAEKQQKIADLKSRGGISQLNQLSMEIESLNNEVKNSLRHLQKPFIKLQSLTLHGGGSGLTPEEIDKINQYLENPFEAFSSEEAGYPLLRQILQKLMRSMAEGKLKLKPDKMRKAQQAINEILNKNSLVGLHQKCIDVTIREKRLSTSTEMAEAKSFLVRLQEQIEKLEQRRKIVESEENMLEQTYSETLEKIRSCKSQIERNILDFTGKKVCIE